MDEITAKPSRVTLKAAVIAEIIAANPGGRLKAVEYDSFGAIKRIEWYDSSEEATCPNEPLRAISDLLREE